MVDPAYMAAMARQIGLWGIDGQKRIGRAHAAVGGVGGIGAAAALMLAKSGLGALSVCDRDEYAVENIVEQAFAMHDTVGQPKADVAVREMARHAHKTQFTAFTGDLSDERDATRLIADADILISGVDNPEARLMLGRICRSRRIPMVVCANVGWSVFHTVYLADGPGYLEAWRRVPNVRWLNGGPDLKDAATRDAVRREWSIWVVALAGYEPEAVKQLLTDNQAYYWYAAPQAFFAASLGVLDALKMIAEQGAVMAFPEVFYYDMRANRRLEWPELARRRDSLYRVWDSGPDAIAACTLEWEST